MVIGKQLNVHTPVHSCKHATHST